MNNVKTATLLTFAAMLLPFACTEKRGQETKIVLTAVKTPGSLPVYVALEQGIFRRHGLAVELREESSSTNVMGETTGGKGDAAVTGSVAATLSILRGNKILVAACIATSDSADAIVTRPGFEIASAADLKGKRIGVARASSGEYFLDFFLLLHHIPRQEVTLVYMDQKEFVPRLERKEIDAVSSSLPFLHVVTSLQGKGRMLEARDFFNRYQVLVVSEELVQKRPEAVRRLIEALSEAETRMAEDPQWAKGELKRCLGYDDLSGYLFDLRLDEALLVDMVNISGWAANAGYSSRRPTSFINKIYFAGLEAVRPQSVTVIR